MKRRPTPLIVSTCTLFASLIGLGPTAEATAPALSFSATGYEGGGFQNVLAVDPAGSGLMLSGADVSGFHRSLDWGRTWTTSNTGIGSATQLKVATIAFSPSVPGKVYAGVGFKGTSGGLLVSTDGGVSWSVRSTAPRFSGHNNPGITGLPAVHPRSTGNILAFDRVSGLIYAATFHDGVMRSADDGVSWTTLGLAGTYLRSMVIDPADPDVLYAAAYGDGIYKTSSARTDGTFTKLAGSPAYAEELVQLGGALYAAAGPEGISVSTDGGGSWAPAGSGTVPTGGPVWTSINGYLACGQTVLYAGADQAGASSVITSTNGGATWSSVSGSARIHPEVGGPGGERWWLSANNRGYMLGGGRYTAAHIAIEPAPPPTGTCLKPRVFVAGRSGVWGSTDAGSNWYPLVRRMGVTVNRGIAADPNVPGRVYAAAADWVFVYSTDSMEHVTQKRPVGGGPRGWDIALDTSTTPSTVFLGTGDPYTNIKGEIFSNRDPASAAGWVSEGLSSVTGGKRPIAVAVNTVGSSRVILAAVDGDGLWRKSGTSWKKVRGKATATEVSETTVGTSFSWPQGSSTVYFFDRTSGIWRSNNNGTSWTQIWVKPSSGGYVAADPANPARLYASIANDGLYRLDGADSGSVTQGSVVPVRLGTFLKPGPVAVAPGGGLYVATLASPDGAPSLSYSGDAGTSWQQTSDNTYRATAVFPLDMSVGPDGTVYQGLGGNGVIRGRPAG